jgi:hypothetical protein
MMDQMSPGGHAATTVVASAAIAFMSGSLPLATAVALGGFFIDVDHGGGQKGERIVSAERLRHEAPAPTRRVEPIPATGQHL